MIRGINNVCLSGHIIHLSPLSQTRDGTECCSFLIELAGSRPVKVRVNAYGPIAKTAAVEAKAAMAEDKVAYAVVEGELMSRPLDGGSIMLTEIRAQTIVIPS